MRGATAKLILAKTGWVEATPRRASRCAPMNAAFSAGEVRAFVNDTGPMRSTFHVYAAIGGQRRLPERHKERERLWHE